jgi:alpha-L-rhamnosidase
MSFFSSRRIPTGSRATTELPWCAARCISLGLVIASIATGCDDERGKSAPTVTAGTSGVTSTGGCVAGGGTAPVGKGGSGVTAGVGGDVAGGIGGAGGTAQGGTAPAGTAGTAGTAGCAGNGGAAGTPVDASGPYDEPWPAPTPDQNWHANFIWQAADGPPNTWMAFRKAFDLSSAPATVPTAIAVDTKYWLWVNGRPVVFEGGLKRGPTQADSYHDQLDLAPYLSPGKNTLAVLVWYFGKHGWYAHKDSGKGGLMFQADLGGKLLSSDSTWRLAVHTGYRPQTDPGPRDLLAEWNVEFDARTDLGKWIDPGFDDSSWAPATEKGVPPALPWGRLWQRPIPQWRSSGIQAYENQADLPTSGDGSVVAAKLPYNAQVTPYLHVRAPAGLLIDMRTELYDEGPTVRATYTTRDGEQKYESFGWMNGQEIRYTIPAGVEILGLGYRETGYDTDLAGSFASDDPHLDTLWKKAQRTLYANMRDNYFDCPTRERAQWWGDVVIDLGIGFNGLDRRVDALTRKAIAELVDWRNGDVMTSPVPWDHPVPELPQQMLASVGRFGFWNYYLHSADWVAIQQTYSATKAYLALWEADSDGLVKTRYAGWPWADWGDGIDYPLLENAWYYLGLDGAAHMADLVGTTDEAAGYRTRMATMKSAYLSRFWTGTELRSPDNTGNADDRGHGLAVVAGLIGSDKYDAVKAVLANHQSASPYLEKYVLEALFVMGDAGAALTRMRQRYAEMIQDPSTTLFEIWQRTPSYTTDHAWAGGPLTLLSEYVAGIQPIEPGYQRFRVLPQLGDLTRVSATVAARPGPIRVNISAVQQHLEMSVEVPPETSAVVGLPLSAVGSTASLTNTRVTVNGSLVLDAGTFTAQNGISFVGTEGGYSKFAVVPGNWSFVLEMKPPSP